MSLFQRLTVDRIWVWLVAIAFLVIVPLWLITAAQDWFHGALAVVLVLLFAYGIRSAWSTDKPPQGPSTPQQH